MQHCSKVGCCFRNVRSRHLNLMSHYCDLNLPTSDVHYFRWGPSHMIEHHHLLHVDDHFTWESWIHCSNNDYDMNHSSKIGYSPLHCVALRSYFAWLLYYVIFILIFIKKGSQKWTREHAEAWTSSS